MKKMSKFFSKKIAEDVKAMSDDEMLNEINHASIGDRLKLLLTLFEESVRINREPYWQRTGPMLEVISEETFEVFYSTLQNMVKNKGKIVYEKT